MSAIDARSSSIGGVIGRAGSVGGVGGDAGVGSHRLRVSVGDGFVLIRASEGHVINGRELAISE